MYVCEYTSATTRVQGSENNFHKLVLKIELTDNRLSGKCLYLMSHFPEPFFKFSYTKIFKVRHGGICQCEEGKNRNSKLSWAIQQNLFSKQIKKHSDL